MSPSSRRGDAPKPVELTAAPLPESNYEREELREFVRGSLTKAFVGIVILVGAVGVAGKLYEAELLNATEWVLGSIGLPGLAGLIILADAFMSPVPPDLVLIVIAKSPHHAHWVWLMLGLGFLSAACGNLAVWLGSKLGHTRVPKLLFGRLRHRYARLVGKYGGWAVAIAALTPIPFSVICWAAGMFHMPARRVAPITLLRLPRMFLYYVLIAYSDAIVGTLF